VSSSHPRWLVERWVERFGIDETEKLLEANNRAAPTVLRINARRTERDAAVAALEGQGCRARPTQFSPVGIACELRGSLAGLKVFRDGLVTAQGEASQIVGMMVPAGAERVLDACAAPGGKATHLAERSGNRIVAVDRSRGGARNIAAQAARLGLEIDAIRADSRTLPFGRDRHFDAILVDAPCSGLGTLRQHPEIRWRRARQDVVRLAEVQAAILDEVAPYVADGGILVYATCTLAAEENEDRISSFLESHPEFELTDPRPDLPETAYDLVDDGRYLRTFPHRHDLDGFFAARLRKRMRP
jgi:16S rRNA (cytosine967-C5)-methyltransferase